MELSPWMLVAVEGEHAGKRFPIPVTGMAFGRELDNDVILDDERISRRHARLVCEATQVFIEDLKSRNGTFVNNRKVGRQDLADGDRIALGSSLFLLEPRPVDVQEAPSLVEATVVQARPSRPMQRTQAIVLDQVPRPVQLKPLAGPPRETAPQVGSGPPSTPSAPRQESAGTGLAGSAPILEDRTGNLPQAAEGELELVARAEGAFTSRRREEESPFNERTEILLEGSGGADRVNLAAGPVYGGAAAAGPESVAPELVLMPPPLPPLEETSARGNGRTRLLWGGIALVVAGGVGLAVALNLPPRAPANTASTAPPELAPVGAAAPRVSDAFSAPETLDTRSLLSDEERALSPEKKVEKAAEYLEQGESYVASDRLKEARREFEKAAALNPDCEVCMLRLHKVQAEIKRNLERYRNEALRSFEAMEYVSARRYWEMVLELETDAEGRRTAIEGLRLSRERAQQ